VHQRGRSHRYEQYLSVAEIQQGTHPFGRIIAVVDVELRVKILPILRQ